MKFFPLFNERNPIRFTAMGTVAFLLAVAFMVLLVTGCSTTRVDGQWSNPDFSGTKLSGKILVVGISRDDTVRRLYEDEMAVQLAARGVTSVRSHELIAGPLSADGTDALLIAARTTGATMLLASAVIDRQHVERVISEPMPLYGNNFNGWYGYYWPVTYTRTEVRSFERYTVGTSLTDVVTGKIIWSARTQTENVDYVDREIKAFAKVIIDALVKAGRL